MLLSRLIPIVILIFFLNEKNIAQDITLPHIKNKFVVIAHRGDHIKAIENSLQAYTNAINDSADYVEIDLRTSKDNQLVIMHDASVDRMTNCIGDVRNFLLDSLKKMKLIDKKRPDFESQIIPTFKQVLQLCKNKINIYLDFKDADVAATYQEILDFGMEKNIVVYINAPHQYYEWKKTAPNIPIIISLPRVIATKEQMNDFLDEIKVNILDGDFDEYNKETVQAANKKNIVVWPDIQSSNEGKKWRSAIKLNIQGLQTDHPMQLINFLKRKNIR